MKWNFLGVFAATVAFAFAAFGGNPQRIGHTTLLPRDSNPDDGGLYNAFIDPTNGYAYFLGNYLFKVCISNYPPVPVGQPTNTGSSSYVAIDTAAGYAYIARPPLLNRYSLGVGTNPITSAGSLKVAAGNPGAICVDDSDANPSNHYACVFCTVAGSPTRMAKISLVTFTNVGYSSLNAGETNGGSALVDAAKGYAYFATRKGGSTNSEIVKIKMMPGTNLPVRIGSVSLGATEEGIGFGSLDPLHGYTYYGTYGYSNLPSRIYKVKLGDGDSPPTLVGNIDLHQGRAQLSLSVIDPINGFVYFANDNTYPGGVHQFSLNGTNLPVEVGYLHFKCGPSNNPPDTVSTFNVTTNADGVLPYGEVYLRSAIFDPVRGYAYFGQDSKPNQFVTVKLAQVDPFTVVTSRATNGTLQLEFTNIMGGAFSVWAAASPGLPFTNWTSLGNATESSPGQFQFSDPQAPTNLQRFYRVGSSP